ncbi:cytochrome P450 [Micromonospora chersina]|uniref:cytochrome P450 n=1 Tax=Micromonospora chersina TaxID=47854 RepID=UPI003684AC75
MSSDDPAPAYPFTRDVGLTIDKRYRQLLHERPVSRVTLPYGGEAWLVLDHAANRTVLADRRFSRAKILGADLPRMFPQPMTQVSLLSMDPPDHTRIRRLVAKPFSQRRVEQLRPEIGRHVDLLLDDVERAGAPADLMSLVAARLPLRVICLILGVPEEDRAQFDAWSETAMSIFTRTREETAEALGHLSRYIAGLVAQRRARPTDDLLSELVAARDGTDRLSEDELVFLGVTLLVVGHETAEKQVGNLVHTLLTHPDELAELRKRPDALPAAVEELLRYIPVQTAHGVFPRVATEDVQLGDVLIRAGETVFPFSSVANHDPRAFDHPDELDFDRESNPHLAFGHGIHACLGSQLARLELQELVRRLLDRFPELALAVPEAELAWSTEGFVRGLRALPVTW